MSKNNNAWPVIRGRKSSSSIFLLLVGTIILLTFQTFLIAKKVNTGVLGKIPELGWFRFDRERPACDEFTAKYWKSRNGIDAVRDDHIHPFARERRRYERMSRLSFHTQREHLFRKSYEPNATRFKRDVRDELDRGRRAPPTGRQIAYVHVGKAAGSTLCKTLTDACHMTMPHPCEHKSRWSSTPDGLYEYVSALPLESEVSKHVRFYYHAVRVPHLRHGSYLVNVRDPLWRLSSAYVYFHPLNENYLFRMERKLAVRSGEGATFYNCFASLDGFARGLVGRQATHGFERKMRICTPIGRRALSGRIPKLTHLYYNYRRQAGALLGSDANEIFAVRSERFWDDLSSANRIVSTAENATALDPVRPASEEQGYMRRYTSMPYGNTDLTDLGRAVLCYGLRGEFEIYHRILSKSVNLNGEDVLSDGDRSGACTEEMIAGKYREGGKTIAELWDAALS